MAEQHPACLVCNHANLIVLSGYQKDHLVRCGNCDFVFSQAIPTSAELEAHYEGYERTELYLSPITIKRYQRVVGRVRGFQARGKAPGHWLWQWILFGGSQKKRLGSVWHRIHR